MTDSEHDPNAASKTSGAGTDHSAPSPAQGLASELAARFREQVQTALETELMDDPVALAFADHYLSMLRGEDRPAIVGLFAAQAGAWFGELVRREFGATWIGDSKEPRRLRLLLEPAFVHLSPVDLAYEAIFGGPAADDDARLPDGAALDASFHLRKRAPEDAPSDHAWVTERLAEFPPMAEDQFHSLTGRFETLQLIVELLAERSRARGHAPHSYQLDDYVAEIAGS